MNEDTHFRNLTTQELQQSVRACTKLHTADPHESFLRHCQATLNPLLSNVHFSAEIYSLDPLLLREQEIHTLDNEYWIPLFVEHIDDHPYAQRLSEDAGTEVGMTHRESSLKTFRKSSLYNEFYDHVEAQNQLWVGIRDGNELLNCVYSRDKVYSDKQLAMMCLIQPHLETAWKNWKHARSLQQELKRLKSSLHTTESEQIKQSRIKNGIASLTSRQRTVVEHLAAGKDNQQIADELKISVWTVKKHLQAIYQRLAIHHRTELAAHWHHSKSAP